MPSPAPAPPEPEPHPYPEHDKLRAIKDQSQLCGEFLEWMTTTKDYRIHDAEGRIAYSRDALLAEFFEIDRDKIGAEKDAMVAEMRAANERPYIPAEVETAAIMRFCRRLTDDGDWVTDPFDFTRVVFAAKTERTKDETWDLARRSGVAVTTDKRNGWRKFHTENFWAYYAVELAEEVGHGV